MPPKSTPVLLGVPEEAGSMPVEIRNALKRKRCDYRIFEERSDREEKEKPVREN
jgi:hypothetical protein